jgi:uncharacterized phage protein gp47/JayE
LEQFVAKELLLEETGDTSENAVEQHGLEELKAQYLTQLLHQEEVETRITEPEEAEIQRYYEKNKKNFVIPARVRISLIGISEGKDGETDEGYLARVLAALRNPARYGKGGDFAAWALDSSPKVSAAWEFKNFSVFGALLVQVISGNQTDGVSPVGNLEAVKSYLNEYAPPVLFEVGTPEIINLNPAVALQPLEDSVYNRGETERRLKTYLQFAAKPGCIVTAGALRLAVIDGVDITEAAIKLNGDTAGLVKTTVLEYPVLGEVTWE